MRNGDDDTKAFNILPSSNLVHISVFIFIIIILLFLLFPLRETLIIIIIILAKVFITVKIIF